MGRDRRVDPAVSERLGHLLTTDAVEREPLHRERTQILKVAAQAFFLARDGAWRPVRDLSSAAGGSEDERRRSNFAPDSALLSDFYTGAALEFFRLARSHSGYGPGASLLLQWANGVHSPDRRCAVFRYVIEGTQGRALAEAMRSNFPPWVGRPVEALLSSTPCLPIGRMRTASASSSSSAATTSLTSQESLFTGMGPMPIRKRSWAPFTSGGLPTGQLYARLMPTGSIPRFSRPINWSGRMTVRLGSPCSPSDASN